jgi:hypothetical protein
MHVDKISAQKKTIFLDKALSFNLSILKFTEGHLITCHQMKYPRLEIKIDTRNYRQNNFNLTMSQSKDYMYWMTCVGFLTKQAWFSKNTSLISFQQLDLNRHGTLKYEIWFQNKKDC